MARKKKTDDIEYQIQQGIEEGARLHQETSKAIMEEQGWSISEYLEKLNDDFIEQDGILTQANVSRVLRAAWNGFMNDKPIAQRIYGDSDLHDDNYRAIATRALLEIPMEYLVCQRIETYGDQHEWLRIVEVVLHEIYEKREKELDGIAAEAIEKRKSNIWRGEIVAKIENNALWYVRTKYHLMVELLRSLAQSQQQRVNEPALYELINKARHQRTLTIAQACMVLNILNIAIEEDDFGTPANLSGCALSHFREYFTLFKHDPDSLLDHGTHTNRDFQRVIRFLERNQFLDGASIAKDKWEESKRKRSA